MTNRFYNTTFAAAPQLLIRSITVNAQFKLIDAGFVALQAELDPIAAEVVAGRQGQASLAANLGRYIVAAAGLTQVLPSNGFTITGLPNPVLSGDACNRAYADALAFNAVSLPAQTGNVGKYVRTDGTNASWENPFMKYEAERAVRRARQLTFA